MKGNAFNDITYHEDENAKLDPDNKLGSVDESSLEDQRRARYIMNTRFRSEFSYWVMVLIPAWLFMVLVIIILQGFRVIRLDSTETVALLATTSANVLGLAYIVLKGFFGNNQ